MSGFAIETQNLTKDYPTGFLHTRKKRSLEGLNLQVATGEIFGFLGPNGAGKSTTIKLLTGLIFPTAGSGTILGKPLGGLETRRFIGYLPEQPYFYDYLSAEELLDYFARFFSFTATDRRERVRRMLELTGLGTAAKMPLRKYSKGMLQRVGLAQAILHSPRVAILDEPMSGLDPIGRREVRDIILDLKRQGTTVLFSTHILSDAEMLCDRVGVIIGGKLRGTGAPDEIAAVQAQHMEILFEVLPDTPKTSSLFARATQAGNRYRLEVPEAQAFAALTELGGLRVRILSVTPVKASLEDYFIALMGADAAQASAVDVSEK
jgi:ABC-2 type transport system ATP-binding protein